MIIYTTEKAVFKLPPKLRQYYQTTNVEHIIELLALNPKISDIEGFCLCDTDFSNADLKNAFMNALARKYPSNKVLFINTSRQKNAYANPGFNIILERPNSKTVADALNELIAMKIEVSETEISQPEVPEFVPEPEPEPEPVEPTIPIQELPEVEPPVQVEIKKEPTDELLRRIENLKSMGDVTDFAHELSVGAVIKELSQESAAYSALEGKIDSLNRAIASTLSSSSFDTLSSQLSTIRGYLHEKITTYGEMDTALGTKLIDLLSAFIGRVSEIIDGRMEEIKNYLVNYTVAVVGDTPRLAELAAKRAELQVELNTALAEVDAINMQIDRVAKEASDTMVDPKHSSTESPLINDRLAIDANLKSTGTINALTNIADYLLQEVPEQLKGQARVIKQTMALYDSIIKTDAEIISQSEALNKYLKSNSIDDLIKPTDKVKATLRVYTGQHGAGLTIIPYLIFREKCKTGNNCVLVYMRHNNHFEDYGIKVDHLQSYDSVYPVSQQQILTVDVPNSSDEFAMVENLIKRLTDFYSCIILVADPEDIQYVNSMAPIALSINYIATPQKSDICAAAEFVHGLSLDNTAVRVIINKGTVSMTTLVKALDIAESMTTGIVQFPMMSIIQNAALEGFNPADVPSVINQSSTLLLNA